MPFALETVIKSIFVFTFLYIINRLLAFLAVKYKNNIATLDWIPVL